MKKASGVIIHHFQTTLDLPGLPREWTVLILETDDGEMRFSAANEAPIFDRSAAMISVVELPPGLRVNVRFVESRTTPPMRLLRGIQLVDTAPSMFSALEFVQSSREIPIYDATGDGEWLRFYDAIPLASLPEGWP